MADLVAGPTWVLAAAAFPSVASGLWIFARWWVERGDKHVEGELTREQVLQKRMDERQDALSKRDWELMVVFRDEAERCRARADRAEHERDEAYRRADQAWDLARAWKERCHRLKHALDNARTIINALLPRVGEPPRPWPIETLPPLEEIVADNLTHAAAQRL